MKNKVYIRVGILFLAAIIIVFWGINYLKGKNVFTSEQPYYSFYEKIGGLTVSSPVTLNGFQVGQVRDINLSKKAPLQIEVKYSITYQNIRIPEGSVARIYSTDLMGTKGISLDFTDNQSFYASGDTLPGSIEGDLRDQVNTQMLPIKQKAEELMSSMDSVLASLQMVFGEKNQANLSESFSSVNGALQNVEAVSKFLNEYVREETKKVSLVLGNLDSLSRSLREQTGDLHGFMNNMNRFSDTLASIELAATFIAIQSVLDDIEQLTQTISSGEGTIGQIVSSDSLYRAILATNTNLNRLIEDIRINPGRYIRVSLADRSRSIYTSTDTELARTLAGEGSSDYYVCLTQSSSPLQPEDPALKGHKDSDFIQIGSVYYYYSYRSSKIDPCLRRLASVRKIHPSAGIFTWLNGKWTRLVL
jgi:phospholipid/cholesterol/gamma-HCH transport system substrate-binding protein